MKSTLFIIIYLFIAFISILHVSTQNVRFTIKGRQCVFPMKHNGMEYNNCIINDKGQEWCYSDKLGMSWNYCARGDFKIDSSILFKNIKYEDNLKNSTNFCLYHDIFEKKIFAVKCSILLQLKKHKIDKSRGMDTNNFEFFWINHSQIKTKEGQKCLHPVETPIIEERKIAYTGYIQTKDCIIADDLIKNSEQKWKIDENGRILNEYSKRCLVRSNEFVKLSDQFKDVKLDVDFDIFSVNLGDCLGNPKGYQGREIWLLDEFRPELLELMALDKLMKVYNGANKKVEEIHNGSNDNILKLINYTTNLIGHKKILDEIENKLESEEINLKNLDFEKKFNLGQLDKNYGEGENFNLNGVLFQMSSGYDLKPEKIFIGFLPSITNSKVSILKFLDLFNESYSERKKQNAKQFEIDEKYRIIKISGFLINNLEKYIKIRVETNSNFQFILNSNIIYNTNSVEATKNSATIETYTSESFKLLTKSLNQFSITISNFTSKKLNFKFDCIHIETKSNKQLELSSSNFIPIMPKKKFILRKSDFMEDLKILDCDLKKINLSPELKVSKQFYYCDPKCLDSQDSICSEAYKENKLPPIGGLIDISFNKSNEPELKKLDFNMLGIDLVITEVKLGYIREFDKYSDEIRSSMLKNFIIQLNTNLNYGMKNGDDSFLFYKKYIPKDFDELIVINAKLICDNSNFNQASDSELFYKSKNLKIEIEKIHDMINGISILLYKIKYRDYLELFNNKDITNNLNHNSDKLELNKNIPFVDELRLSIFTHSFLKNNFEEIYYKTESRHNKFVCSINNKNILLQVKFKSNNGAVSNIIDYHADFTTKFEDLDLFKFLDKSKDRLEEKQKSFPKSENIIKCSDYDNSSSILDENLGIHERYKLICASAYEKGLITKSGGVFKIFKNNDNSIEFESVTGLPSLQIFQKRYRIISQTPELDTIIREFIKNEESVSHATSSIKSNFSSFLQTGSTDSSETSSTSKFYSNDLLLKLEQGLNRITDKIIDSSKKISDVTKVNEELENKIKKIEVGENSLSVISKRIEEISKLETNLEERVNKKFEKFKELLNEKDKKIKELNLNFFSSSETNNIYDLQNRAEEFYSDWLIVDTLNSINGPSDWNLKLIENKGKYVLTQNSSIKQIQNEISIKKLESNKNNPLIASSLILKNFSLRHLHSFYSKIIFQSNSFGLVQLNFRYKDYQNYISLQLERKSNDEGFVRLIQLKDNIYAELQSLQCDKMMTVLEKCYGYHMDNKENLIEILNYEEILQIKFNKFVIFHLTESELKGTNQVDQNLENLENFVISINNQNNLIISQFILREMNAVEKVDMKNNKNVLPKREVSGEKKFLLNNNDNLDYEDNKNEMKLLSNEMTSNNTKQPVKQNLKYNPITNKFEFQTVGIPSQPNSSEIEKDIKEKVFTAFDKVKLKNNCLKHEKEEYVCNYITNIIYSHKININVISEDDLEKLIRSNCISMMKNNFVCDQILNKLEPLIHKLKNDHVSDNKTEFNLENISKSEEKVQTPNKREISNLIKACSFEFLPNLLKNRKICLNEIMRKELNSRQSIPNDECVKEFCNNCCFINYGNPSCKICE